MTVRCIYLLLWIGLTGCSRTLYVPVETEKIRSEERHVYSRDSVFLKDSVFLREKNDTVYVDRVRYHFRDKYLYDTILIRDSVTVPVFVETVKKERYIPRFYRWCMGLASGVLVYALFRLRKFLR